ncbi:MAG: hypothetical protein ACKV2V_20005, partial [Blastocatellia bacterium]
MKLIHRIIHRLAPLALIPALLVSVAWRPGFVSGATTAPAENQPRVSPETYGQVPMSFERNEGQADARVKYLARGRGYGLFLTANEALLQLRGQNAAAASLLRMRLRGASAAPVITGEDALPGKSNYFLGNDPARWQTGVDTFGRVAYRDVYPGVNLVYYGNQRELEYDFVVAPGADPHRIRMEFSGARGMRIDADGALVLT